MYIIIELQANADGTVGNIVQTRETLASAESVFHSILAAAAISAVPKHSAVLLSEEGFPLRHECYRHDGTQTEPAPQDEANIIDA